MLKYQGHKTLKMENQYSPLPLFSSIPSVPKILLELIILPLKALWRFCIWVVRIWLIIIFLITPLHWFLVHQEKTVYVSNEWRHSDKETTRLLNYITGKDSISFEERLSFATQMINAEKNYQYSKEDSANNPNITFKAQHKLQYLLLYIIPPKFSFNQKEYQKIWELEKENGSPKVRFVLDQHRRTNRPYWAYYHFLSNTIYMNFFSYSIGEEGVAGKERARYDNYLPEILHAGQYGNDPIGSAISISESASRVSFFWLRDVFDGNGSEGWITHYKSEYHRPRTLEWTIHRKKEVVVKLCFAAFKTKH